MHRFDVKLTMSAVADLDSFAEGLRDYYDRVYSDTGLDSEMGIRSRYSSDVGVLMQEIMSGLSDLGDKGVIGKIRSENEGEIISRMIFRVRSYAVTAECLSGIGNLLVVTGVEINRC